MPALAALVLLLLGTLLATSLSTLFAASSSVVVTMDVPSATSLGAGGCATGTAGVTDFGTVLPGDQRVTSSPCTLVFGSSNDSAMLLASQQDGLDDALWQFSTGAPDPAFDGDTGPGDGHVHTDMVTGTDEHFEATQLADGSILAMGQSGAPEWASHVAKYLPDGTLDTSFSGDGKAYTNTLGQAWGAGRMPDGRYVLVGNWWNGADSDATISMLTSSGTLDTTFSSGDGSDGTDHHDEAGFWDGLIDVHVAEDGTITASGLVHNALNRQDAMLVRYHPDGTLDTSLGGTGRLVVDVDPARHDRWEVVHVYDDGSILGAGYIYGGPGDVLVSRYLADGTLDPSFNGGTHQVLDLGGDERITALHVMDDGRIVVGGTRDGAALVVRLLADGSLDPAFDGDTTMPGYPGNGYVAWDVSAGTDRLEAITAQPGGGIMGVGGAGSDALLLRVTDDGSLDRALDGTGYATQAIGGTAPAVHGAATLADGGALVVGETDSGNQSMLMSWVGVPISQYVNATTDWDTPSTTMFGACLSDARNGAATDGTTWSVNAGCAPSDGAGTSWRAIPASAGVAGAKVATAPSGDEDATVDLHFGVRTAIDQEPGTYVAPVDFEVVAPAA